MTKELYLDQPEDLQGRLAAISKRLHMMTPGAPWAFRGMTVAHHDSGNKYGIVGGQYQGMGESEDIAMVDNASDASIIICAPSDLSYLVSAVKELLEELDRIELESTRYTSE